MTLSADMQSGTYGYQPLDVWAVRREVERQQAANPVVRRIQNPAWAAKQAAARRRRKANNRLLAFAFVATLFVGSGVGMVVTVEYGPVNHSHSKPVIKSPTYRPSFPTGRRSLLTEV